MIYVNGPGINCYNKNCDSFYIDHNLKVNPFSQISGEFKIPASANDGQYSIKIKRKERYQDISSDIKFTIANFKPQNIKVETLIDSEILTVRSKVKVDTKAFYYSGGPYGDANSSVNLMIIPKDFNQSLTQHNDYYFNANSCEACQMLQSEDYDGTVLNSKGMGTKNITLPQSDINFGEVTFTEWGHTEWGHVFLCSINLFVILLPYGQTNTNRISRCDIPHYFSRKCATGDI